MIDNCLLLDNFTTKKQLNTCFKLSDLEESFCYIE